MATAAYKLPNLLLSCPLPAQPPARLPKRQRRTAHPCSSIISWSSMHFSSTRRFRSWSRISRCAFFTRPASTSRTSSSGLCQVPEAPGWGKPLDGSWGEGMLAPLLQRDIQAGGPWPAPLAGGRKGKSQAFIFTSSNRAGGNLAKPGWRRLCHGFSIALMYFVSKINTLHLFLRTIPGTSQNPYSLGYSGASWVKNGHHNFLEDGHFFYPSHLAMILYPGASE